MNYTAVSSVSSATPMSLKRSAGTAGMEVGTETSGGKRRRVQMASTKETTTALIIQNERYASNKFSGSFGISHAINLLVQGENLCDHTTLLVDTIPQMSACGPLGSTGRGRYFRRASASSRTFHLCWSYFLSSSDLDVVSGDRFRSSAQKIALFHCTP